MDPLKTSLYSFYLARREKFNNNPELEALIRIADYRHGIRQALDKKKPLRTATDKPLWIDPQKNHYTYTASINNFPHHNIQAKPEITYQNDYGDETFFLPLVLTTRGPKTRKHKKRFYFAAIQINSSFGDTMYKIDNRPDGDEHDAINLARSMAKEEAADYIANEEEEDRRWRREQAADDAKLLIKEIKVQKPEGECKNIILGALRELLSTRNELCQ